MRFTKAFIIAIAIAFLAVAGAPGRAVADEGWVINSMNTQVDVQRDGTLLITETILVDFGSQRKHGIFRDIPIRYDYNEEQNRVYDFRMESVTDVNGNKHKYEVSDQGGYMRVKIGDPDREVTGAQSYRVSYRLGRVMNPFEGHDELFLNIIGPPAWPVRIERATATVSFPAPYASH